MKIIKVTLILFTLFSYLGFGQVQQGECSYYSDKYHGRPTASGELYNKNKFTAASSRGHAFGTMLKVTNTKNGLSTIVKVNDIMGNKKRILDLSRAAATKIDMVRDGVGQLKIEPVTSGSSSAKQAVKSTKSVTNQSASSASSATPYRLQYASLSQQGKAIAYSGLLNSKGLMTEVIAKSGGYKIVGLRRFSSKGTAKSQAQIDAQLAGEKPYVVNY